MDKNNTLDLKACEPQKWQSTISQIYADRTPF